MLRLAFGQFECTGLAKDFDKIDCRPAQESRSLAVDSVHMVDQNSLVV